jgi:hypothetical protein
MDEALIALQRSPVLLEVVNRQTGNIFVHGSYKVCHPHHALSLLVCKFMHV